MSGAEYVVKDSGRRQGFAGGSVRDTNEGKARPDLISPIFTRDLGDHMAKAIPKYGEHNWSLGQPVSRYLESAERHLLDYKLGKRDEDHLAAMAFNVMGAMHFRGSEWDDTFDWTVPPRPEVESDDETDDAIVTAWESARPALIEAVADVLSHPSPLMRCLNNVLEKNDGAGGFETYRVDL